jgi:hypothetical protein
MTLRVRKQIYIDPGQETLLKQLTQDTGLAEAEIIRQAIDRQIRPFELEQPRRDLAAWDRERAFIAQLIERGPVPGERAWKREDLYER